MKTWSFMVIAALDVGLLIFVFNNMHPGLLRGVIVGVIGAIFGVAFFKVIPVR